MNLIDWQNIKNNPSKKDCYNPALKLAKILAVIFIFIFLPRAYVTYNLHKVKNKRKKREREVEKDWCLLFSWDGNSHRGVCSHGNGSVRACVCVCVWTQTHWTLRLLYETEGGWGRHEPCSRLKPWKCHSSIYSSLISVSPITAHPQINEWHVGIQSWSGNKTPFWTQRHWYTYIQPRELSQSAEGFKWGTISMLSEMFIKWLIFKRRMRLFEQIKHTVLKYCSYLKSESPLVQNVLFCEEDLKLWA